MTYIAAADAHPTDAATDAQRARSAWADGRCAIGLWSVLSEPIASEISAASAADIVVVDCQHGAADEATLPALLQGMRGVGRTPFVRVRDAQQYQIMRALDAGASGVVVPMITTAADASAAVAATRFPPQGIRSWGPLWSASRGVLTPARYNDGALCALMIETSAALDNLDAILAVEGVGALYIGPNDLALSCGWGRATYRTDERVNDAITHIVERATRSGVPVGLHCSDTDMAEHWRAHGVLWVTSATDADLLASGVRDTMARMLETHGEA